MSVPKPMKTMLGIHYSHSFITFDLTRFQRVVPPFQSENHIKLVEDPVESKVDRTLTLFHRLFKSIR